MKLVEKTFETMSKELNLVLLLGHDSSFSKGCIKDLFWTFFDSTFSYADDNTYMAVRNLLTNLSRIFSMTWKWFLSCSSTSNRKKTPIYDLKLTVNLTFVKLTFEVYS